MAMLPDDNTIDIDVRNGYRNLLWYYTTSNVTADEAYDLGLRLITEYYGQVRFDSSFDTSGDVVKCELSIKWLVIHHRL